MNSTGLLRSFVIGKLLTGNHLQVQSGGRSPAVVVGLFFNHQQTRESRVKRRTTHPAFWHATKNLQAIDDKVTQENRTFIKEFIQDKYFNASPVKGEQVVKTEWTPKSRRTGVIARNIGCYPMWQNDGTQTLCTLLQVLDNHVIRYIPPEVYCKTRSGSKIFKNRTPLGCLVVGAEAKNPEKFTKQYCNLFKDVGLMPKKRLARFLVTPDAALPAGTPLYAGHFVIGQVVDVLGKTIDYGFQGVMKRFGFKGGPASHGATKFHRRGGTVGTGRDKARIWPGTKMPGHMGSEHRFARGLKILRINMKYNVIFVKGPVPGGTNAIVRILDTVLPLRKPTQGLPHPTYFPPLEGEQQPEEDIYEPSMHVYGTPSITAT
nr:EOG090X07HN [Ilyocryptus agilis]